MTNFFCTIPGSSFRNPKEDKVSREGTNFSIPTPSRPPPCTWVKSGRLGSFFVLCFLALGGHCLQMLCLPGFGTHTNTQNLPHFRAFPASIWEHSLPKCLFFKANAKLPNCPGFALLQTPPPPGGLWIQKVNLCALFSCLRGGWRMEWPSSGAQLFL